MKKQQVTFVLDEIFSGDLPKISRDQHVWICESETNNPRIRAVRKADQLEYSQSRGVTSFEISGGILDTFYSLLGTINEHHAGDGAELAGWSQINVFGVEACDVNVKIIASELQCECEVATGESTEMIIQRLAT